MRFEFNEEDIDFLVEALQARASRHESIGRANPRSAGPHDRAAVKLRDLARKLVLLQEEKL